MKLKFKKINKKLQLIIILILLMAIPATLITFSLIRVSKSQTTFPANTTIVKDSGKFAYKNITNSFTTHFKAKATDSNSIAFANNLGKISFYTPQKQVFGNLNSESVPVSAGSILTYPEIFPSVDLQYTVSSTRLLEEFIIKDKVTANKVTRIEQIAKTDLKYKENSDGSIDFIQNKKTAFILPAPILYEKGDKDNKSNGIKYEIKKDDSQLIITKVITPEGLAWINDPSRVYPIVIDLVIDNADTSANWVSSDTTNTVVSQETTIKQEGTGSVKIQTTADSSATVDLMEYSSDANAQSAYVTSSVIASGGTESTSGVYRIHKFTTDGTLTVTRGGNMEVLVVGGGGASGGNYGGGGGGGGLVYNSSFAVASGNVSVTVGSAGITTSTQGGNGGNSVFSSLTGTGGGGGGYYQNGVPHNGSNGGCGGGAGGVYPSGSATGGTGSQGYNGGGANASGSLPSGGGGGMGGAGALGSGLDNYGGAGVSYSISGSSVTYSGGGHGTYGTTNGSTGVNTGSGGPSSGATGNNGFSGIVIARYPYLTLQSYTEGTIKTEGSYSLKGVATATNSLNKTLTRTIASPIDLSNVASTTFSIRSTRTGSNIKVGLHDSGGTTTEVTPNVTSADTFQTATIDLSGVTNANKDAIDQIIITIVNADADNTFYIDNFTNTVSSLNNTITRTTTPQDLSSYNNISFWVRSSLTGQTMRFQFGEAASSEQTYDITISSANTWEKKTWDISGISASAKNAVTLFAFKVTDSTSAQTFYFDDLNSNSPPSTPTLSASYLHDKLKTADTTPEVRFTSTDSESDDLVYQISWDTNSAFSGATTKTSDTDAGFANVTTPADTSPFTSGNTISYTFQSALINNITYFYRVRVKDPLGTNAYSSWSSIRSLTIDTTLNKNQWFETMGDQFSTDTITGATVVSNVTNDVRTTPSGSFDLMEYSSDANAQTAYVNNNATASGGTESTFGAFRIHKFTADGTLNVTKSGSIVALVVAGGGGGGNNGGGGGGGGGIVYNGDFSVTTGVKTVTVGAGGPAHTVGYNSVFDSLTATGGGYGGSYSGTGTYENGSAGGSGGGGSGGYPSTAGSGGSPASGQGYAGGNGSVSGNFGTGGGGGAGAIGGNASGTVGGVGGAGADYSSVFGTGFGVSGFFAGGGGGGAWGGTASSGGSGGGGSGSTGSGSPGTANSGGGGGGTGTSGTGGAGGSGIVLIRYPDLPFQSYTEGTIKTQGTYSLKGVAKVTNSLNKTLTRTIASPINLSGFNTATFDIRSTRTGSNIKVGIHDSGGTTTEITPNITSINAFQTATIDLSGVTNANKDAIDQIIITIVNADADNTFYIDNFIYSSSSSTIVSTPITAANISSTAQRWIAFQFNDEVATNIIYQVYYDVGGVPTIVPDSALTGNSTGFTSSPIDLKSLTTATYPILYLKATLSDSAGTPILYDWGLTLDSIPNIPTLDFPADSAVSAPLLTVLKTTATDNDSDILKYKINLCTDSAMTTNCKIFDQTSVATGWSATSYASGVQATYTIQAADILTPNTTYYWKTLAIDQLGSNTWGTTQTVPYSFTTNKSPNTPSLDFPANTAIDVPLLAVLKTTATDDESDTLKYKIHICTNSGMTTGCQLFDQTVSTPGWSAASYASGVQGIYTFQTPLAIGATYFWRSYSIDQAGSNNWSNTQSSPYSFTTINIPTAASSCRITETPNDTSLTLVWTDNSTNEDRYEVQRSVDGGAFSVLATNLAANTVSNIDSAISENHTYKYRVAPYFTTGPAYGDWCTTNTLTLQLGTFSIKGFNLKGLILQ